MTNPTYTLHTMRKESGVSGVFAAQACGVTYASLRNWEKGDTIPNIIHINILLKLYGYTQDELDLTPFQKKHQAYLDKQDAVGLNALQSIQTDQQTN